MMPSPGIRVPARGSERARHGLPPLPACGERSTREARRMRGALHDLCPSRIPLTPTLSPHAGRGGAPSSPPIPWSKPLATTAFVAVLTILTPSAHAQSVEEFYKGKAINLAIGFDAGGGY